MIDAHIHIALPCAGKDTVNAARIGNILSAYTRAGVYAMRDGGDGYGASMLARDIAKDMGILYKSPLYALYKKGHYGKFLGRPVNDLHDLQNALDELLSKQPDHMKIVLTGIVDFDSFGETGDIGFSKEELVRMVNAAKERELPVMIHCNGAKAVQMAVEAGADTIEHGYFLEYEQLCAMKECKTVWVPTLAPLVNFLKSGKASENQAQVVRKTIAQHGESICKALAMGVMVAQGSDAGATAVEHIQGIRDEYACFAALGLEEETLKQCNIEYGMQALHLTQAEKAIVQSRIAWRKSFDERE